MIPLARGSTAGRVIAAEITDLESALRGALAEGKVFDGLDSELLELFVALALEYADSLDGSGGAEIKTQAWTEIKNGLAEVGGDGLFGAGFSFEQKLLQACRDACGWELGGGSCGGAGLEEVGVVGERKKSAPSAAVEQHADAGDSSSGSAAAGRGADGAQSSKQPPDARFGTAAPPPVAAGPPPPPPPSTDRFVSKRERELERQMEVLAKRRKKQEEQAEREKQSQAVAPSPSSSSVSSVEDDEREEKRKNDLAEQQKFADDHIDEIKQFLRSCAEPVTVFGETNVQRYERYKEIKLTAAERAEKAPESLTAALTFTRPAVPAE